MSLNEHIEELERIRLKSLTCCRRKFLQESLSKSPKKLLRNYLEAFRKIFFGNFDKDSCRSFLLQQLNVFYMILIRKPDKYCLSLSQHLMFFLDFSKEFQDEFFKKSVD